MSSAFDIMIDKLVRDWKRATEVTIRRKGGQRNGQAEAHCSKIGKAELGRNEKML